MADKEIIQQMLNKIIEMDNISGEQQSGSLFLHADNLTNKMGGMIHGNVQYLADAFKQQMELNDGFNRAITAMFGAYLTTHPEEKHMFLNNLNLSDFNHSVN